MVNEYLAKTLKRLFDECQSAQNRGDTHNVGTILVKEFNELLEQYQQEYPENTVIQSISVVEMSGRHSSIHPQDVQQVKQNCLKIADVLSMDTNDFREPANSDSFATIHLQQNQQVEQSVGIENIIEMVDMQPMMDDEKEELRDLVEQYQDEMEEDNPDASRLQELYERAKGYSEQIALQLGAYALKRGIDIILPP
ncbi:hypothetical protein A4G99_12515 [Haladaptatus sp. R4]|uniref:hypothetical protein n=1 Tax=Haladaptatus sp. R4 TaxID=1679489 RepID=UPI0007B4A750|nr:hypothetical protein [Haladaptatus sp. R4]KZN23692.1 hypothetical protein A4G99_12515 [Haladaptatus sp. R4]